MKSLITAVLFVIILNCLANPQEKSIHQLELEYYKKNQDLIGQIPKMNFQKRHDLINVSSVSKIIYGFHPYWVSDATAENYYYSLLTHIAYFSAEVDNSTSTTGGLSNTHNWATTQIVNYCKQYGTKIHLSIVMFEYHDRVLNNSTYRNNLINNILAQMNLRNADGVNIDFESVSSGQAVNFRNFIKQLGDSLNNYSKELVVCIPSVDWSNVYNSTFFSTNNSVVDYYFLMAYDYYYKGSSNAGPVSPLTTGTSIRHVMRSINDYISAGVSANKLLAAFGYYGYDWPVSSNSRMASTTGVGVSYSYASIKSDLSGIPSGDKFFDGTYNVPWYRYQDGTQWHQLWYEDSSSIIKKYDSIKIKGIAGTGIWALSYDGSNTELMGALKQAFASTSNPLNTILANFENSLGTFNQQPTYSGSTVGISVTSSTKINNGTVYNGYGSLKLLLIDSSSSSANWVVRLLSGIGNPINNVSLSINGYIGFWMKTSSAPPGSQLAITIDDGAGGTELSSKINVINDGNWNLYQWRLPGTGWTSFAGGNGVINGPTITLDAIMFYASNNSPNWTSYIDDVSYNETLPLPVQISSFSGRVEKGRVILIWKTETEIDNFGFDIERKDFQISSQWNKIGFLSGNGNSNNPNNYEFVDNNTNDGRKYFYRLKQIDANGSFMHSKEIEVAVGFPDDFMLYQNYPNPFNPITKIKYSIPFTAHINITVYDILGNIVSILHDGIQNAGNYTIDFNGNKLSSGIYFYEMKSGNYSRRLKMLLVK